MNSPRTLTMALTKGRILGETLPLLSAIGIEPLENPMISRKLILPTSKKDIKLVVLRGADVPIYVRHGAADLGVVGKDVLLEDGGDGIYETLDLGIARCRLMTAAPIVPNKSSNSRRIRVATKFVNIARKHFAQKGAQVDVIRLYGAMELAPLMGLADQIVDIVDTGKTLRENGLEPLDLISDITSRLIVNKAAMRTRHTSVRALIEKLSGILDE